MTVPIPTVSGQNLVDLCNGFLGGYQNAVDSSVQLSLLNEGKNEVWMILKSLRADWFIQKSQSTDSTQNNYFGPLVTTAREYPLPKDYHEMKFVEILDVGLEDTEFIFRDMASAQWKDLRRASTNQSPSGTSVMAYHYDIIAQGTMILAEFPAQNFNQPVLWYVRMVPDFGVGDPIDQIIYPYSSKIAMYAAKIIMLQNQDEEMYERWVGEWKDAVARIAMSASPRQISDTVYIDAWDGTPADAMDG